MKISIIDREWMIEYLKYIFLMIYLVNDCFDN